MAYDNAKFRIEVFDDGETDVTVIDGSVMVINKGLKVTLKENEKASFNEEELLEKGKVYSFDEWENWNISRDKIFADIPKSARYLPDELHPYAYDFEYNGVWVYVKEYGYVWQPTVIVVSDWVPYKHGYWMWIKRDYVWISLEPWGWVPCHYGRWVYTKKYVWVWVPPSRGLVYWGPGYVVWVYTPDYVCWAPLAPGEIYYGYGNYGPYSVNIVNVKVYITNIVYKNINAPNGYVVIHKNNFLTAKQIYEKTNENPFFSRKAVYGRPDFYKDDIKKVIIGRKIVVNEKIYLRCSLKGK